MCTYIYIYIWCDLRQTEVNFCQSNLMPQHDFSPTSRKSFLRFKTAVITRFSLSLSRPCSLLQRKMRRFIEGDCDCTPLPDHAASTSLASCLDKPVLSPRHPSLPSSSSSSSSHRPPSLSPYLSSHLHLPSHFMLRSWSSWYSHGIHPRVVYI